MNTFGERLRLTLFGESHGEAIGMVLDGFPPGTEINLDFVRERLALRAPGGSELSSARREPDEPVFLSGLLNGRSTGAPICAIIKNTDARSGDYSPEKPRPGHADLTARVKFKGFSDFRGGGPFSGRLTAAMTLAGALCLTELSKREISIESEILRIGTAVHTAPDFDFAMRREILDARASGDSVGGIIECRAKGLPAGLGSLFFGGMESRLAAALFSIPGVKGVEFGAGFEIANMRGSEANDPICLEEGRLFTETNHAGGLNGGLTNGMPLVLRCAFRPTPSISREQKTVDLSTMENVTLRTAGRHDPCIVPRAVPVVESLVAFCLLDALCEEGL